MLWAIALFIYLSKWLLDGYGTTTRDSTAELIPDSPHAREIISRIEAVSWKRNHFFPFPKRDRNFEHEHNAERLTLLKSLPPDPELIIPPNTICRALKRTESSCSPQPGLDSEFIPVRIAAGPAKGKAGWACMGGNVGLPGPLMP